MFLNYLRVAFDLDRYPRPLLLALENKKITKHILMHAHHLRTSEQYKGIFISSDMTKSEREKHKRVTANLGETNFVLQKVNNC